MIDVLLVIHSDRHAETLYVLGDCKLRHGGIVAVIDAAKGAGVCKSGHRDGLEAEVASVAAKWRYSRP
jgi:hypothetical protein